VPGRVGWGLVLTAQNEIVVHNEIQLKTVQNKDSDQKTHQNLEKNAIYMYSVRNERIMVTLFSPKSELKTSILFQQFTKTNHEKQVSALADPGHPWRPTFALR